MTPQQIKEQMEREATFVYGIITGILISLILYICI